MATRVELPPATAAALGSADPPWADAYHHFWQTPAGLAFADSAIPTPISSVQTRAGYTPQ